MGIFDKIKKFASGSSTATVAITSINGVAPGAAVIAISDTTARGSMTVTAQQDCTMLAMKYEVLLRTQNAEGAWSNITVGSSKTVKTQQLKVGDVITHDWQITGIDIDTYLRNQSYTDMAAVPTHPKVKLLVRCISDVEGSPFDPEAELEVKIGPSSAAACRIETTSIEGQPASSATFPVTDSVCKGTVVVAARSSMVLTATRYELWLEIKTPNGLAEELCAKDQHPELKVEGAGILGMRVSFGGTNITFPHAMGTGDKATQTWSIGDINIAAKLAAHGINDPHAAVGNDDVVFVLRTFADAEGGGISSGRTVITLV